MNPSQFAKEIEHPDNWWEYRNVNYDQNHLPKLSEGPHVSWWGGPPDWESKFHGLKWEALYAIVSDWDDPD